MEPKSSIFPLSSVYCHCFGTEKKKKKEPTAPPENRAFHKRNASAPCSSYSVFKLNSKALQIKPSPLHLWPRYILLTSFVCLACQDIFVLLHHVTYFLLIQILDYELLMFFCEVSGSVNRTKKVSIDIILQLKIEIEVDRALRNELNSDC